MKRLLLDFFETNSFPRIFLDYISGKDSLASFYKYTPNIGSFKKVIEDKSKESIDRKVLVEVLKDQNSLLPTPNSQLSLNIDSLLSNKTFTVTTGHQLCIFTGPLFSVYKILSAIKLTQELKKSYPENNFVPVFWMVTEDHDFEEINHVNIFGKKIVWNLSRSQQALSGKVAAGSLICEGMNVLIDELKGVVGKSENADYLLNMFRKAYDEKNNLADATRLIINELFGKFGLLILDARDKRLKNLFVDVMKEELLQHSSFKYVNETITQLEANYKAQVKPRTINLFYLKNGERNRIVKEENSYKVLNTDKMFSEAEILNELQNSPDHFSPNVVLRPLYQEKILPNLAYIGGPGEVSYWLEYKRMFEYFKVNYPMLPVRNTALLIDEPTASKMSKLGIRPEEIFADIESLIKSFLERNFDHAFSLEYEGAQIEKLFSSLIEKANAVDITLKASVEGEKQKQLNGIKSLEEKIIRAQKKKHETSIAQVRKIKEKLFPEGNQQERFENFIPYYLKYGEKYFDMLLDNFDVLPDKFLILAEGQ